MNKRSHWWNKLALSKYSLRVQIMYYSLFFTRKIFHRAECNSVGPHDNQRSESKQWTLVILPAYKLVIQPVSQWTKIENSIWKLLNGRKELCYRGSPLSMIFGTLKKLYYSKFVLCSGYYISNFHVQVQFLLNSNSTSTLFSRKYFQKP